MLLIRLQYQIGNGRYRAVVGKQKNCLDLTARLQQMSICYSQYTVLERYARLMIQADRKSNTKKNRAIKVCALKEWPAGLLHSQPETQQPAKNRISQRNQCKALIAKSFFWQSANSKAHRVKIPSQNPFTQCTSPAEAKTIMCKFHFLPRNKLNKRNQTRGMQTISQNTPPNKTKTYKFHGTKQTRTDKLD